MYHQLQNMPHVGNFISTMSPLFLHIVHTLYGSKHVNVYLSISLYIYTHRKRWRCWWWWLRANDTTHTHTYTYMTMTTTAFWRIESERICSRERKRRGEREWGQRLHMKTSTGIGKCQANSSYVDDHVIRITKPYHTVDVNACCASFQHPRYILL